MLKITIFYLLAFLFFNFSSAAMEYKDMMKEDLFSLSKNFTPKNIKKYKEDLSTDANKKLQLAKSQINNYSLEKDLIPQVISLVAEEALMASTKILDFAKKGSTVLYLGRSPSVLLAASDFLTSLSEKTDINHVQISFSGTPNIPNQRNYEVNDLRNVATREQLLHFCRHLDDRGLNSLTPDSQLYIVDQIGKGAGMNAFLRILRYYYTTYKSFKNTPEITLLLMNFNNKGIHFEKNCYMYNPETSDFIFCNSTTTKEAYRGIRVKAYPLGISEKEGGPLDAMDDELVQYYLLNGREYPAFC